MTHEIHGPVGIIADTHDDDVLIQNQLQLFAERDIDVILHAGDVTRPETIELFGDYTFHHVWGNGDINDGPDHQDQMKQAIADIGGHQDGWSERYLVGARRILMRHGMERSPSYAAAASDDSIDVVVHGHLHYQEDNEVGGGAGRVFNPGNTGALTYDPVDDEFEFHDFDAEDA